MVGNFAAIEAGGRGLFGINNVLIPVADWLQQSHWFIPFPEWVRLIVMEKSEFGLWVFTTLLIFGLLQRFGSFGIWPNFFCGLFWGTILMLIAHK